jgi:hypothetical protein
MYLVVRRGAVEELDRLGQLAGAAAVACLREFADSHAEAIAAWLPRPGKVVLRARSPSQWARVLEEPHAGDDDAVVALPPRRRSERGPLLERLQAMSSDLGPPPAEASGEGLTYVLNPSLEMSSGKIVAQVAHAAVMAAERLPEWAEAGCPARLVAPRERDFSALKGEAVACVVDAGLTEVPPGTITVVALQ